MRNLRPMPPGYLTLLPETSGVNLRPALGRSWFIPWSGIDTFEKGRVIADELPPEIRDDVLWELALASSERVAAAHRILGEVG